MSIPNVDFLYSEVVCMYKYDDADKEPNRLNESLCRGLWGLWGLWGL